MKSNPAPDRTIGPTPERLAKAGDAVEVFTPDENEHWRAIRLIDTHVLAWLQSRGVLTGDQYAAGAQFYGDWYLSGLANSGVIDPARVVVDGGKREHLSDIKMAALTRWQRAVQALGMIHSQVLTDVLLSEERLEDYGRRRFGQQNAKLARLAAQTALKLALEQLDYYYHGQRRTPMRSSHVDGYRPEIMPEETSA